MERIFLEVLNRSISASWLILAIIILRPLLRKVPKWLSCLLWALVAVRLLSPFSFESVLSLIPSSQTIDPDIIYSSQPRIHTGIDVINSSVNPAISQTFAPNPGDSANPLQIVSFAASLLWLIGVAGMLLYAMISYFALQRRVSPSLQIGKRIRICDSIDTAFILGFIRPKIYLPSHLQDMERSHVIAHEMAHIKRKDHLWKPLGYFLLSINWYNPLMWIAYILLSRDIEEACDEYVIRDMDCTAKRSYSEALLNCSIIRPKTMVCPLAFGEVGIKARIKRVLSYKKPTFWIIALSCVICLVAALCFLTDPKPDNTQIRSDPFGKEYIVSEIIYDAPQYSYTYQLSTAPHYRLTKELELKVLEDLDSDTWLHLGILTPYNLKIDDFESPIFAASSALSPSDLIKDNAFAWRLDIIETDSGNFYYLLQQKDGSLLLCIGHHHNNAPVIRWIFQLAEITQVPETDAENDNKAINESPVLLTKDEQLEAAIKNAILDNNRTEHTKDLFACESHILLDEQTMFVCGSDTESSFEETTVYLMALYQEYDLSDGRISDVSGSHMPIALTFRYEDSGYILTEYWTPQDGSYYLPSIQEKFPENCWALASDTQIHILGQIQSCYDQAVLYADLDTDSILNDLYVQIESSPAASSVPADHVESHYIEYRELTYYGIHTLQHAFETFLNGDEYGLRGHLMAMVCQDLFETMGEPFNPEPYKTGENWFEQFKQYALELKPQIESPYSSQFRPVIRLLLNML